MKGADFTGFLGDFVGVWGGMGQPESQSSQQKIVWQDTKLFCFFGAILFFQAAFGWGSLKCDAGLGARGRILGSLKCLPRVLYGLLASRAMA